MKKNVLALIVVFSLLLAGCGGQEQITTQQTEPTTQPVTQPQQTEPTVPETIPRTLEEYTFMEVGVPYPYTTHTYTSKAIATTAEATVTSYEVFDSAPGYPAKEGYEWRVVKMEILYHDKNANDYGCSIYPIIDDYHDSRLYNDTSDLLEATEEYHIYDGTVLVDGVQMETYCYWHYDQWGDWFIQEDEMVDIICHEQWDFLVPVGYDGCIAGLWNGQYDFVEGGCITDCDPAALLMFRAA